MATEARRVSQPDSKSTVHFILQGKGGVGKSAVAAILAQYLRDQGRAATCIDTDPVNSTFYGYQSLSVQRLAIMRDDEIDTRTFDQLVELVATCGKDVIVDNGASSFVPLSHYLVSNRVPSLLVEMGHRLVVHTVITGGQALPDTLHGCDQLVSQFPADVSFVVWLNPYFGAIEHDGKTFQDMKTYRANKDRIAALVNLPKMKQETFGVDFSNLLQSRTTFAEAREDSKLGIMTRQRLKQIQDEVFAQLQAIPFI